MDKETYLGDGVYASFDGYQVWLRVDDGSRIALEPEVMANLNEFMMAKVTEAAMARVVAKAKEQSGE
jgi:hypothetical protein